MEASFHRKLIVVNSTIIYKCLSYLSKLVSCNSERMNVKLDTNTEFWISNESFSIIAIMTSLNSEFPSHNSERCHNFYVTIQICFLTIVILYLIIQNVPYFSQ